MAASELRIELVNPVIGAEVQGVDLSTPLTPPLLKELRAAWLKHQVLFFRDQRLTKAQHKAFGRQWGTPHVHPRRRRRRGIRNS